ncbi:hypothetical protein ACFST9_20975 [Hymenobacter monticola]|uniref:Uncharacterized protein n=1 Tax=Hymenobacter monticola TaxID=1705399 RepID=A0ABY4B5L6_9BACT|nr:hypothetical protein [Hymenobacter monticola]UOE34428.1 hypothetical protein MTP16_01935 [Hymenobacter monticola]
MLLLPASVSFAMNASEPVIPLLFTNTLFPNVTVPEKLPATYTCEPVTAKAYAVAPPLFAEAAPAVPSTHVKALVLPWSVNFATYMLRPVNAMASNDVEAPSNKPIIYKVVPLATIPEALQSVALPPAVLVHTKLLVFPESTILATYILYLILDTGTTVILPNAAEAPSNCPVMYTLFPLTAMPLA